MVVAVMVAGNVSVRASHRHARAAWPHLYSAHHLPPIFHPQVLALTHCFSEQPHRLKCAFGEHLGWPVSLRERWDESSVFLESLAARLKLNLDRLALLTVRGHFMLS